MPWLRRFYFGDPDDDGSGLAAVGLKERIGSGWEAIDARAVSAIPLGHDADGRLIAVRVGRYGAYLQADDEDVRASLPDDEAPDELTLERALRLLEQAAIGDRVIAQHPDSGKPVYLKTGRYGPYVQLGEDDENDGKPKRTSLWPGMAMDGLSAEQALELLSYPRLVGVHPETGEEITAQDGPSGPYIRAGSETRSLRDHEHLQHVEPRRRGAAAQRAEAPGAHRRQRAGRARRASRQRRGHRAAQRPLRPLRHRRPGQRLAAQGAATPRRSRSTTRST